MLAATLLPLLAFASTAFALPAPQVEARNDGLPEGFYRTGRCLIVRPSHFFFDVSSSSYL